MTIDQIETPECQKMYECTAESQPIGEFLEWLQGTKKMRLCVAHEHDEGCYDSGRDPLGGPTCGYRDGEYTPVFFTTENLLAEYFEIDLKKVEEEKQALLKALREGT